jgi:ribosome-associated protein
MADAPPIISLPESEIKLSFIRSPGPGGQNVNKVATGVVLRFNVKNSPTLTDDVRTRLLLILGNKVTSLGELVIKATRFRTQERNKQDALDRLQILLAQAAIKPKKRKKTKPTYSSTQRRLAGKKLDAKTKSLRQNKSKNHHFE